MTNEELIRSVIELIVADGEIAWQEKQLLRVLCQRPGISKEYVDAVLKEAQQPHYKPTSPDVTEASRRLFGFLIHAAAIDDKVVPEERDILESVGTKLGLSREEMKKLFKRLKRFVAVHPLKSEKMGATFQVASVYSGSALG